MSEKIKQLLESKDEHNWEVAFQLAHITADKYLYKFKAKYLDNRARCSMWDFRIKLYRMLYFCYGISGTGGCIRRFTKKYKYEDRRRVSENLKFKSAIDQRINDGHTIKEAIFINYRNKIFTAIMINNNE